MAKKSASNTEKNRKQVTSVKSAGNKEQRYRVFGLFLLLSGVFLLFAFFSWLLSWKADFAFTDTVFRHFTFSYFFGKEVHVENWMGRLGALLSYLFISRWFGIAAFFVVFFLIVTGLRLFSHVILFSMTRLLVYGFSGLLWFPLFFALVFPQDDILFGIYGY